MIDLMKLVIKAAKYGVGLGVRFDEPTRMIISARRGNLMIQMETSIFAFCDGEGRYDPHRTADRLLDELIRKLNEGTEQAIQIGDERSLSAFIR